MTRELACRKCKFITSGRICAKCKSSDLTPDWRGIALVIDPEISQIAKTLNIKEKGKYALKVT